MKRKNLFIKDEKNLLRTLNTYANYQEVETIELSYNTKKNKFEISLNDFSNHIDNNSKYLIYDRLDAVEKRKDKNEIFQLLESDLFKGLFKNETIEKYKNLINSFQDKDYNSFFNINSLKAIKMIEKFITIDTYYIHNVTKEKVYTKSVVAKRLYSTLYNRLTFYIEDLETIKKDIKEQRLNIELQIKKEFYNIDMRILAREKIDYNLSSSYKDIIIALELYDRNDFNLSDLFPTYTLEMLINEKMLHEETKNEADLLKFELEDIISKYFSDYIKIKMYLKRKQLEVNKKNINLFFDELYHLKKRHEKLGGLRRNAKLLELKNKFGEDWKTFIKKFNNKPLDFFIKKMILMDKHYKEPLNFFDKIEIDNIFNGKSSNNYYSEHLHQKVITTKEELKVYDGYYELLNNYNRNMPSYESPNRLDYIRELEEKYSNHKIHPYAQEYLKQMDNEYEDYIRECEEKALEDFLEEQEKLEFEDLTDSKNSKRKIKPEPTWD
jgi:hypothetical protein